MIDRRSLVLIAVTRYGLVGMVRAEGTDLIGTGDLQPDHMSGKTGAHRPAKSPNS
jgi:hypothetical protein